MIGDVKIRTRFRTKGREIRKRIDGQSRRALIAAGELAVEAMREATPVKTGRARDSISWRMQNAAGPLGPQAQAKDRIAVPRASNWIEVGSALWYMKYLHFGTRRTHAYRNIDLPFERQRTAIRRGFVMAYQRVLGRRD